MVRPATAEEPSFRVSTVDLDRRGTTYTADTLQDQTTDMGCILEIFLIPVTD